MSAIRKSAYIFWGLCLSVIIAMSYLLFFPEKTPDSGRITISLTPHTAQEERELIRAQMQDERTAPKGPLIALVSVEEAQARVLEPDRKK